MAPAFFSLIVAMSMSQSHLPFYPVELPASRISRGLGRFCLSRQLERPVDGKRPLRPVYRWCVSFFKLGFIHLS